MRRIALSVLALGVLLSFGPCVVPATSAETTAAAQLKAYLQAQNVPAAEQTKRLEAFKRLPAKVQDLAGACCLRRIKPSAILGQKRTQGPAIRPPAVKIDLPELQITQLIPASAGPGDCVYVWGFAFGTGAVVQLDGAPQPTFEVIVDQPALENALVFIVPNSAVRGKKYSVTVTTGDKTTASKDFTVVATRGYRGLHGWSFVNKGGPLVPWEIFRNYFGQSVVEFPDGSHRPAAQQWYDAEYSKIAMGGNCYGMSLLSLRVIDQKTEGLLHTAWWAQSPLSTVWDYTSNRSADPVWQSIQEMQASQLAEPQYTLLWSSMDYHTQATWAAAQQCSPHGGRVLLMANNLSAHATVAYATADADKDPHRIFHYDNNFPYTTGETNGPDASVALVFAADRFMYNNYVYSWVTPYETLLPAIPTPPWLTGGTDSASAGAAGSSYLIVPKTASVSQITDEAGHTFYANGRPNEGTNRIPGAVYTVPIMGGPVPNSYPHTWLFANSTGKSLTVELAGNQGGEALFIQKGVLTTIRSRAAGLRFTTTGVNTPAQRLVVANPGAARVESVRLIAVPDRNQERTFEIQGISQDMDRELEVGLNASRAELQLTNRSTRPAALQVTLRSDAANSHAAAPRMAVNLTAAQTGVLRPNWRNLATQQSQLDLQGLDGARQGSRQLGP